MTPQDLEIIRVELGVTQEGMVDFLQCDPVTVSIQRKGRT